ncbi:MAG: AraC family transcriptional regulator [Lachnospiraceae bacterium]|nr:AraC family transcriptional regulator [Lachnospiraceae bacterium]
MRENLCDGTCDKNAKVLYKNEDCIVYQVKNADGELKITEYQVFSGIWLCYKDAHTQSFTYPASYPSGLLEITHCREGRFEYDTREQFFYLSGGDISVCKSKEGGAVVYCPTRHYHGISVIIDPVHAPRCLSCFLDDVNVSPFSLLQKFCKEDNYFIMRSTVRLEHVFSELYSVPPDMQKGYFKVKILELLMFLTGLDINLSQAKQRSCSKAQVELAKQVCRFINENMDIRLTVEQLAEQFFVSPAKLRKCFNSVYGESIYAYIRAYKMRSAAHCLKTTERTISEIAGDFGYDNCSKFSKAFRDVMGVSPTEYRQNNIILE